MSLEQWANEWLIRIAAINPPKELIGCFFDQKNEFINTLHENLHAEIEELNDKYYILDDFNPNIMEKLYESATAWAIKVFADQLLAKEREIEILKAKKEKTGGNHKESFEIRNDSGIYQTGTIVRYEYDV